MGHLHWLREVCAVTVLSHLAKWLGMRPCTPMVKTPGELSTPERAVVLYLLCIRVLGQLVVLGCLVPRVFLLVRGMLLVPGPTLTSLTRVTVQPRGVTAVLLDRGTANRGPSTRF